MKKVFFTFLNLSTAVSTIAYAADEAFKKQEATEGATSSMYAVATATSTTEMEIDEPTMADMEHDIAPAHRLRPIRIPGRHPRIPINTGLGQPLLMGITNPTAISTSSKRLREQIAAASIGGASQACAAKASIEYDDTILEAPLRVKRVKDSPAEQDPLHDLYLQCLVALNSPGVESISDANTCIEQFAHAITAQSGGTFAEHYARVQYMFAIELANSNKTAEGLQRAHDMVEHVLAQYDESYPDYAGMKASFSIIQYNLAMAVYNNADLELTEHTYNLLLKSAVAGNSMAQEKLPEIQYVLIDLLNYEDDFDAQERAYYLAKELVDIGYADANEMLLIMQCNYATALHNLEIENNQLRIENLQRSHDLMLDAANGGHEEAGGFLTIIQYDFAIELFKLGGIQSLQRAEALMLEAKRAEYEDADRKLLEIQQALTESLERIQGFHAEVDPDGGAFNIPAG